MGRDIFLLPSHDIDNPWTRLPWILVTALLIWGGMLWGFGLLLGQMAEQAQSPKPIVAQLVEIPSPAERIIVPKPSIPKPIQIGRASWRERV
jgi:hypothetical protein